MTPKIPKSPQPSWGQPTKALVSSPRQHMHMSDTVKGSLHETPTRATRATRGAQPTGLGVGLGAGLGDGPNSSIPSGLGTQGPRSEDTSLAAAAESGGEKRNSVKHLTCFWWKERGKCRHSDEDCLYAHYDTGRYTEAPRQVIPGERAKAGRNLNRTLRSFAISTSLQHPFPSLPRTTGNPFTRPETTSAATKMTQLLTKTPTRNTEATTDVQSSHTRETSQTQTERQREAMPQSPIPIRHKAEAPVALQSDLEFIRNLLEQGSRDKAVLTSAYERLSTENSELKHELDASKNQVAQLQAETEQLTSEREILGQLVSQLQDEMKQSTSDKNLLTKLVSQLQVETKNLTSERDILRQAVSQIQQAGQIMRANMTNPFGAIGSSRPGGQAFGVGFGGARGAWSPASDRGGRVSSALGSGELLSGAGTIPGGSDPGSESCAQDVKKNPGKDKSNFGQGF